jgi:hypothetical protein
MVDFKQLFVTDFRVHITDEATRVAARNELVRRGNQAWLDKLDAEFGRAFGEPTSVKAPAKPSAKPKAKSGIGSRGGDVAWGLASATTKGQGYEARAAAHAKFAEMSKAELRKVASAHGLKIA